MVETGGFKDGPDGKLTRLPDSGSSPAQSTAGPGWPVVGEMGIVSVTSRAVWSGSDMKWMSLRAAGPDRSRLSVQFNVQCRPMPNLQLKAPRIPKKSPMCGEPELGTNTVESLSIEALFA